MQATQRTESGISSAMDSSATLTRKLGDKIEHLGDRMEHAGEEGSSRLSNVVDVINSRWSDSLSLAKTYSRQFAQFAEKRPLTMMAGALFTGFVISRLLFRGRRA